VITNQPAGVAVIVSNNVTFTVGVTGDAPLSYQWFFNNTNAVGLNTNALTLTNVQVTNTGNYTAVITNASGTVTSAPAALTVSFPPVITNQPANLAVVVSNDATFTVGVTGDAPLSYQWFFNATNAVGLNTNALTLINVQATNAGNYTVVITNASGSATSSNAVLFVMTTGPVISVGSDASSYTFILSFATQNGLGYYLEYKDDLESTNNWQELTNVVGTGDPITLELSTSAPTMRYFRLRVQ
jgi:hypothetical protein